MPPNTFPSYKERPQTPSAKVDRGDTWAKRKVAGTQRGPLRRGLDTREELRSSQEVACRRQVDVDMVI
jgi:hypothetical protein